MEVLSLFQRLAVSIGRKPPDSSGVKMELASNYQKKENYKHQRATGAFKTLSLLVPVCAAFLPCLPLLRAAASCRVREAPLLALSGGLKV